MSEISIPGFSGFEDQFNDDLDVRDLVADLDQASMESSLAITPTQEAIEISNKTVAGLSSAMGGNPRCDSEEGFLLLRLAPGIDSDALDQPNLAEIRELYALSGPFPDSDHETFLDRASIKITNGDSTETIYELELGMPPRINVVFNDLNGEPTIFAARELVESDHGKLTDAVRAVEAALL